jgi:NADH-quinone oxidoreductase subunit C
LSSTDADAPPEDAAPGPAVDEARTALVAELVAALGDAVVDTHVAPGLDAWVRVRVGAWADAAAACRQAGLTYFGYLSVIDWLPSPYGKSEDDTAPAVSPALDQLDHGVTGGDTRFQLLARVVSPTQHLGVTLKADLPNDALVAPTWMRVYPGADWHEREAWEMFGISFDGHPNLSHLYLPGGFEGHPMRKDFPLISRMVKPWPGLVDVEAMPGEPDEDEEAETTDEDDA